MTTYIFFENQTTGQFQLKDADNNFFGIIPNGWLVNFELNYSQSFEKQYNIIYENGATVSFWLNINADVSRVDTRSGIVKLQIANQGVDGNFYVTNKLIILPNGNSIPPARSYIPAPISTALLLANMY